MTYAERNLSGSGEVISKLRNTAFLENPDWIEHWVGEGKLNSDALAGGVPKGFKSMKVSSGIRTGNTKLGNLKTATKEFTVSPSIPKFIPDPSYNPFGSLDTGQSFSGELSLTKDITLGTFMKGNERINVSDIPEEKRDDILKYCYVQAEVLKAARSRFEFEGMGITVDEGIYVYESTEEEVDGDLASLGSVGRAIAYKIDSESYRLNFELAEYLASHPWHDKIILDYHSYGSSVQSRVFVVLPELDSVYNGSWGRTIETKVNGLIHSSSLVLFESA